MQPTPSLRENVLLKECCTFGIGGPARYFIEARQIDQMQDAIKWCQSRSIPYMILGKGSNCLFDDKGYDGAVILNKIDFLTETSPGHFHVGAGHSFAHLGVYTARKGWSGLEFASGIPASVGGAVYMNAGANGKETCETLSSVDYVNEEGEFEVISRAALEFSYRTSPFQKRGGAIVGATFALSQKEDARKLQIEIVNKRKNTQPYGDMSAGCIFLNPTCASAGALIDKCGLKGLSVGGAQVSHVHANFLINGGQATCMDMLALIELVKRRVKDETGIELHSEVRHIPYVKED